MIPHMDRRLRTKLMRRATARRKRVRARQFEDLWATVLYSEGDGYRIQELYSSKADAEAAAVAGTRAALGQKDGYAVIFAVPTERGSIVFAKGATDAFVNLRSTTRMPAPNASVSVVRSAVLFATREQAEAAAAVVPTATNIHNRFIGGPISKKP